MKMLNAKLFGKRMPARSGLAVLWTLIAVWKSPAQSSSFPADSPHSETELRTDDHQSVWEHGVGEGFQGGAQSLTLSGGAAYGFTTFGGSERHDLALGSLTYGRILDDTLGRDHWLRGNFEFRVELFGGAQFSPRDEWLIGATPHLRFDFATGTRWVPYLDGGAGVSATSIRKPDLGGAFQFNLQAAVGVQRFVTDNVAVTLQAGYMHISSAHISTPNDGVNCLTGMAGVSFFF